jgi:hypothetical protein
MTKERDWLNHKSKCLEMERVSQEEYLAAAQAQVAQLKTALQEIVDCPAWAIGSLDMQRYRELMK